MLSRAVSSIIFWVFGMTQPSIEPQTIGEHSTHSANGLLYPGMYFFIIITKKKFNSILQFIWHSTMSKYVLQVQKFLTPVRILLLGHPRHQAINLVLQAGKDPVEGYIVIKGRLYCHVVIRGSYECLVWGAWQFLIVQETIPCHIIVITPKNIWV